MASARPSGYPSLIESAREDRLDAPRLGVRQHPGRRPGADRTSRHARARDWPRRKAPPRTRSRACPLLATLAQVHTGERLALDAWSPTPGALRRAPRRPRRPASTTRSTSISSACCAAGRAAPGRAHRARERLPQPEAQRDAAQEGPPRRLAQPALARPRLRLPHRPARRRSVALDPRVVEEEIREPRLERRRRRVPDARTTGSSTPTSAATGAG